MQSCPEFERMLARSGIVLLKWFSVSDEEQERRFQARVKDPATRWKLSPMDIDARNGKNIPRQRMPRLLILIFLKLPGSLWKQMKKTGSPQLSHILSKIQYLDITPEVPIASQEACNWLRPPSNQQAFVPQVY